MKNDDKRDPAEFRIEHALVTLPAGWRWRDAQRLHGRTVEEQFAWISKTLKQIGIDQKRKDSK